MKNLSILFILPLIVLSLTQCNRVDTALHGSVDKMVLEHKDEATMVNAAFINELMEKQAMGLRIVDVREPAEFEAGHIPGAINIPRGVLEFSDNLTNRRERVFLYSNHHNRSVLSAANLRLMKFKNVAVLEGGFESWKAAFPEKIGEGSGNPVSGAPVKQASAGGCGD